MPNTINPYDLNHVARVRAKLGSHRFRTVNQILRAYMPAYYRRLEARRKRERQQWWEADDA